MIKPKDLTKIGYTDNVARSMAVAAINKHCKRRAKEEILAELADVLQNPANYAGNEAWGQLAEHFCPQSKPATFECFDLLDEPLYFKKYGGKDIEAAALQAKLNLPVITMSKT